MEPITPQTRVQPSLGVLFNPVGDESVLLNVEAGVYFALNPVGTLVWRGICDGEPLGEIQTTLQRRFAAEVDVVWADLLALVSDLRENGLVTILAS